jgi:uncharacterized repeat protein (TIGR03847 family)
MRSLGSVEHFVAGAIGEPGSRTFLLEVGTEESVEWFLLEKEQVAVLARRSLELLRDLGASSVPPGPALSDPGEITFRVGEIGIGAEPDGITIVLSPTDDAEGDPVAFRISPARLEAMARKAVEVVAAGRPPCRHCGLPRSAEGHVCPSSNGDLRVGS